MNYIIIQTSEKVKDYKVVQICKKKNEAIKQKEAYQKQNPFNSFKLAKYIDDRIKNYGLKWGF